MKKLMKELPREKNLWKKEKGSMKKDKKN